MAKPFARLSSAAVISLMTTSAIAQTILNQSVITPAAQNEIPNLCQGLGFPAAWTWTDGSTNPTPVSATSGTPKIEQYRAGVLIATYAYFGSGGSGCALVGDGTDWQHPAAAAASGCGAFNQHTWRLWAPGDSYLVYPAVYSGEAQQPAMMAMYDGHAQYDCGVVVNGKVQSGLPYCPPTQMSNVTVTGVVVANERPVVVADEHYPAYNCLNQAPVCFGPSTGVNWDSINVQGTPGGCGRGGVFIDGANNLTIARSRVTGFETEPQCEAMGIFGTNNNTGFLLLEQVELDHNGGTNGPGHNAYINNSLTDPNFRVRMEHSYSHDAYYGHLFKSRAQQTVMYANYFQGGVPQDGYTQAETYLLDVPNGGHLIARDNIFVKNASGTNSNALSISFLEEGTTDARPHALDITHNTFVAMTLLYDDLHPVYPMGFFYPELVPGQANWPANIPVRISDNAYVGYCPTGQSNNDYRGALSLTEAFSEIGTDYTLATKYNDANPRVIGQRAYGHVATGGLVRTLATVGAED